MTRHDTADRLPSRRTPPAAMTHHTAKQIPAPRNLRVPMNLSCLAECPPVVCGAGVWADHSNGEMLNTKKPANQSKPPMRRAKAGFFERVS